MPFLYIRTGGKCDIMRKYVSLLLAGAMVVGSLSGCGSAFEEESQTTAAVTAGEGSGDTQASQESVGRDGGCKPDSARGQYAPHSRKT